MLGKAHELLDSESSTSSMSGITSTTQTNIILKEYNISKSDLALYKASGDLKQGRADPFAEVPEEDEEDSIQTGSSGNLPDTSSNSSSNNSSNGSSTSSDGTFFNSTKVK